MNVAGALAAVVLTMASSTAYAFPIAVGAVGAGVFGMLALPVAFIGLVAALLWKGRTKEALIAASLLISAAFVFVFIHDYGTAQAERAALFTPAKTNALEGTSPFPFMEIEAQRKSLLAVKPAELLDLLASGEVKALRLSTYPSILSKSGSINVNDIWRDKDLLIDRVKALGEPVVFVDEYGGIAGTVAESAARNFGLDVKFLQGGTTALSKAAWGMVDAGVDMGGRQIPLETHHDWLKLNPNAFVLGVTKDDEFVHDGWLFGDRTLTLADFLSSYDELRLEILSRDVFVSGFETHDTGGTLAIVNLLRRAGIATYYVNPDKDEILIKPPYYSDYENADRLISLQTADRYIKHHPNIHFLDFSEQPWAGVAEHLGKRYHHLPMQMVASGELPAFVDELDTSKSYVGLAFDRRTAYHSTLAGERLSERGAGWLGRFTLASVYSGAFFNAEELNTPIANAVNRTKAFVSSVGAGLSTYAFGCGFILGLLLAIACYARFKFAVAALVGATLFFSVALHLGRADTGLPVVVLVMFTIGNLIPLLVLLFTRLCSQPVIKGIGVAAEALPMKAALLNTVAAAGFEVPRGVAIPAGVSPTKTMLATLNDTIIVRSAAPTEAVSHGETAGIYSSFICTKDSVQGAVQAVVKSYKGTSNDAHVIIQNYVVAEQYGVVQFLDGDQSGYILCELGTAGAVTDGRSPTSKYLIPVWDMDAAALPARKAAQALLKLAKHGIYSLEVAVYGAGDITVLQASAYKSRACARNRLLTNLKTQVQETANCHPDPLSASIVAALTPGHIFAFGRRTFCKVMTAHDLGSTLAEDIKHLDLKASPLLALNLLTLVRKHKADMETAARIGGVEAVAKAIKTAGDTIGRINRIATIMLHLDHGRTKTPAQPLGQAHPTLADYSVVKGAVCFDTRNEPAPVMVGFSHIKEISSELLYQFLAKHQASINAVIEEGRASDLLNALNTQWGVWSPFAVSTESKGNVEATEFVGVLAGNEVSAFSWRLPHAGIVGPVVRSITDGAGIVVIDDCAIDKLTLLDKAIAVVAYEGSATSHLMQHAAWRDLPVVIGGDIAADLKSGEQVRISAKGSVQRA